MVDFGMIFKSMSSDDFFYLVSDYRIYKETLSVPLNSSLSKIRDDMKKDGVVNIMMLIDCYLYEELLRRFK